MSSIRQGFLRKLQMPAAVFRRGINLWPPFLGAGIRVTRVAPDYREIDVSLKLGLFNRNYFGTQFGGSLFAMTDPFFALMMLQSLGPDYVVWDKSGTIEYVKPGRGTVHASFRLTDRDVAQARAGTQHGGRHEPTFAVEIVDGEGTTIARVTKTLYVRRRPGTRPSATEAKPVRAPRGHGSLARGARVRASGRRRPAEA